MFEDEYDDVRRNGGGKSSTGRGNATRGGSPRGGSNYAATIARPPKLGFTTTVRIKMKAMDIHRRFGFGGLLSPRNKAGSPTNQPSGRKRIEGEIDSSKPQSGRKNISKIRDSSFHGFGPSDEVYYKPKVSENFLENWLDFPVDRAVSIWFNVVKMYFSWLLWNNKAMAGLDPNDPTIRSRITRHISILGTAAGLFVVVAIAAFLVPPETHRQEDRFWLDVFGILMFTSSVFLLYYIALILTVFYPLVESLRDDIAFDAYEQYQRRIGGYESYMFYIGLQLMAAALLVAAKILYSDTAAIIMTCIFGVAVCSVAYWAKEIFIALDPISSMHMGLTNDPDVQFRAELLSHFMLRKIPNSIVNEDEDPHQDVFAKKRESQKYQSSNPNTKFIPVGRTSMKYSAPTGPSGSGKSIATVKPFAKNGDEDEEEEDTNGEFLPSGGRYKAPVVEKKTICITRIPFVTPMIPDESEKSTDNRFGGDDDAEPSDDEVHEFDAPAAFDTTVKKSIFTTKNKLGANTVFTSRGTSSTIFTTKGAFKRGTMAIPFSAGARIVPVASNAQVFGQATEAPKKRQTDTKRRSFIQSMSLDDMFCSETYLFEA
eukprot:gene12693-14666_t